MRGDAPELMRHVRGALRSAGGGTQGAQQPGEVLLAGAACLEVGGDAGELALGILACEEELDVYVKHLHRPLAPDVTWIGAQELLEFRRGVAHSAPFVVGSMSPSATSAWRNLRRASNSAL